MSNYLTDIEDSCIAKILSATRPAPDDARPVVNKCDVYRGEKDEVFFGIVREVAPAVWIFQNHAINTPKEFEQATAFGAPMTVGTTENRNQLTWSFYLAAASLRAPKELSHGGPGVIGIYELLQMLIGTPINMPSRPDASPAQLVGWAPVSYAEPFILVGWERLGQTTTAAVYELLLRTRVQL